MDCAESNKCAESVSARNPPDAAAVRSRSIAPASWSVPGEQQPGQQGGGFLIRAPGRPQRLSKHPDGRGQLHRSFSQLRSRPVDQIALANPDDGEITLLA